MSELPNGWCRTTLEEAVEPTNERVKPADFPNERYLGMKHVEAHTNRILETVPASSMSSSSVGFRSGNVLYGRMRPYLNKVVRPLFSGFASAEFIVLPENEAVESNFLLYRLSANDFVQFACSQYEGDRPRVKFNQIGKFPIDLPPRTEQFRIAEKLDELFSDLDAGVAELKAAQIKLSQYRQSLLKAAVEGTLTADWRRKHPPTETGTDLLERTLTERRARWEEKKRAEFEAKGKKPPKNWQSKYPEPVQPETADLSELPTGWGWASVAQVASDDRHSLAIGPFGSNLKVSDYQEYGVPLVFVRNIRSGHYAGLSPRFVSSAKAEELSAHGVNPNEVLITKMGDPPGDADVYPSDMPSAIITADCIKVRCWPGLVLPHFLKAVVNSQLGRDQVLLMTKGVAQKKVSLGRFSRLAIPVPPMNEQQLIVDMLGHLESEVESQRETTDFLVKQSAAQRQNILRAAFAGELVPQDPNDEPASELLARIRTERETVQARKPKRRWTKSHKETKSVKRTLEEILTDAKDGLSGQEAFSRCGIGAGSTTNEIEALYAQLRKLDQSGLLEVTAIKDEDGLKVGDHLKLVAT